MQTKLPANSPERHSHTDSILVIRHTQAAGVSCGHCEQRAARWVLHHDDGHEEDICVYCASLAQQATSAEVQP